MRIVALGIALFALDARAFAAPTPTAPSGCVDYAGDPSKLTDLEPEATKGALTADQKACLEASYHAAKTTTTKGKISRVELVNAYANNTTDWAKLVQRHLDEVDRSDPDICYLYSFYLYNRPVPDYESVIHWSETALDRRQAWTGDTAIARVNQLMKVRTLAAVKLWQKAGSPDETRTRVKTYAREWMDFDRSAGKGFQQAEDICVDAASRSACGLDDSSTPAPTPAPAPPVNPKKPK